MRSIRTAVLALLVLVGATPAGALETDVLFGTGNVKPNVLILFDNSGSMNNAPAYQPTDTYTGTYNGATLYTRCKVFNANCSCKTTQTTWIVDANACGIVDTNPLDGVDDRTPYVEIGNRLNYDINIGNKITIAKSVITGLLQDPANSEMRFGLMVYNNYVPTTYNTTNISTYHNDTGVMKSACQDNNQTNVANLVNATVANGGTPSANRLIAAGNYFAGSFPGFTSPIQYGCQRNYIIDITDGIPEAEGNTLTANITGDYTYIENWMHAKLGADIDPDNDNAEPDPTASPTNCQSCGLYINGGSGYMDDVAWVLQHQDLVSSMAGQQNITTFTIGFDVSNPLLANTAANGGGRYFEATDADTLADAIRKTLNLIATDAQSFVAPVVPVNALKRTQSGDKLYIALFQPIALSNFWAGNIKKFGLNTAGDLTNQDGSAATSSDGTILSTSRGFFDTAASGGAVTRGGVGELLLNRSTARNIYTYLGNSDLTASTNAFTVANTGLTQAMLGLSTAADRTDLINFLYGQDAYDDDNDSNVTEKRDWILGDFIHSTPQVISYDSAGTDRLIIAGANDGMLHAFDDATGQELWAFIPPAILPRLKELIPGGSGGHPSMVDGSPKALKTDTGQIILIFGLRRGGTNYYALDITSKTAPKYLWSLSSATTGFSELGQAWSEPVMGALGSATTYVALFGGGYDTYYDDPLHTTVNTGTPKGRALYAVNAKTGALIQAITAAGMTYPIPSNISAIDATADGTIDLAYVGDLGGNLWRWELPSTVTKIFSTAGHKIFFAPDLVLQNGFIGVFFGTGDLANPLETTVTNRLIAFRDDGLTGGYTETNLVDVTTNLAQEGTSAQQTTVNNQLAAGRGWFVRLTQTGEKALASPLAFFDIFYTTFVPNAQVCSGGGDSYLYRLNFDNGGATVDFSGGGGNLTAADRSMDIGSSIPTEVTLSLRQNNAVGYVGVGGAIPRIDLPSLPLNVVPLYWREMY